MEIQIVIGLIILFTQVFVCFGTIMMIARLLPDRVLTPKNKNKKHDIPVELNAEIVAKASVADKQLNNMYMKYLDKCDKDNRPDMKKSREMFFSKFIDIAIDEKNAMALFTMAEAQKKYKKENPNA